MNHLIRCTGILILCMPFFSCTTHQENPGAAREIVEHYYQLIQGGRLVDAAALYPEEHRPLWRAQLEQQLNDHGALQSYRIRTEETTTIYSGRRYLFITETQYANGAAEEMVTLRSDISDEDIVLIAHDIEMR